MSIGQRMPITLAIIDRELHLPVINVHGWESLNAPYRFAIDVLSSDLQFDIQTLRDESAYLTLSLDHGVHGTIVSVLRLYAGATLSLYRINLGPALIRLHQEPRRRFFEGLAAPGIIKLLLDEHTLDLTTYRFEQLVGVYPPRDICVQHDETDLDLLLRLCAEEGIHFRFEHQPSSHVLIFADDPACFPYRQIPTRFQAARSGPRRLPCLTYLAEQWGLHPAQTSNDTRLHGLPWTSTNTEKADGNPASNQRFEASELSSIPTERLAHDRQVTARRLERQRCERRTVLGLSDELPMSPGYILQVQEHPEARFNDQWLLVEITHSAKQPEVLGGHLPKEVGHVLDTLKSASVEQTSTVKQAIEPFSHGYRSCFRVLPWEMPFRPALHPRKPAGSGLQAATLLSRCRPTKEAFAGYLPIALDPLPPATGPLTELFAPAGLPSAQVTVMRTGTRLAVGHLDNDPDRPIICGVMQDHSSGSALLQPKLRRTDQGSSPAEAVHLNAAQTLHVSRAETLELSTGDARYQLSASRIKMTGNAPVLTAQDVKSALTGTDQPAAPAWFDADLRLTERPGLDGKPLPNHLWYIVRMQTPGLEFIARLQPEHFLFEGKTDEHGYCGLGPEQLRKLAETYRKAQTELCLVYPGHCITLQAWFEQNWPARLHKAFLEYR